MAKEDQQSNGESDEISFLRTEDYICLNCSVITQNGINRRMALAAEAFGNKMCFLEDITLENVTPDFPACIFVLEQSLSVRALQEVVNSGHESNQSGHRTLLYGHAVLLRHLQSNMYLTCLSTSTSNDKLAFDVGLQHHAHGESCWWTIHPASKQRSEGEKVRIGDDIILVSVASERYLHIYLVDNTIHRVNASFQQTLWTLLPISSGNIRLKNTGFINGGEVLRLFQGTDQCFTLPQPGVSEFPYSVFFETGAVCNHARSLWRLEFLRTKWYGGFMTWSTYIRLRHITSGRYLGVVNGEICVMHRDKANADAITFILIQTKDDKKTVEILAEETMGAPTIKYGDTLAYIQHAKTSCWLSYQTYETKKRGVGKVEEKKAALSEEGHMDDCFTIVRAQEEESRSALVIRKCMSLFTKFIRAMDPQESGNNMMNGRFWKKISLEKVLKCLEDLIEFFAQPKEDCSHEDRQNKLKILRNRQDLFHEEGMISLVLETIDKYSETKNQKTNIELFDGCKQQTIDDIYDQLYALLATMIKGNRNNCAQFAQGNRLDLLINRLTSQQASKGVLEVLQCVLVDSPEALNMIKERHIQGIISLLDRNGKDPKVLSVLCSLCANNGIAVRTNQNLICENLLPRRDLLLQTRLIDQIACLRPNIMVGVEQGESMYKKWYFEVEIDFIESLGDSVPHCRIGWATTDFHPTPDSSDGFNSIGVGDDVYSFGFDGANLWFAGRSNPINTEQFTGFKKGDVIGCLLDLSIPEIWFSLNGVPMKGFFREFNLYGMFYPVISVSAKISCRFLFGDEHGRFKSGPPEGCAPIYQAMLQKQRIKIEPCFSFGDYSKSIFQGPAQPLEQTAFTPNPVDTTQTIVPSFIDSVRDRLAENLHEIWAMYKIEQGWKFSEFRNDAKKMHNCLCQFEMLPRDEKLYDTNLAMETLKTMFALGFQVIIDLKQDQKRLKLLKLNNSYLQANGYKPSPLDLTHIALNPKLEELVELLAENTHNVWAKERIRNGWTYGVCENPSQKRHPYLLPYDKVDNVIKKANRETSLDTVKTLIAYGYIIEPPVQESDEGGKKHKAGSDESSLSKFTSRTYRAENTYAINAGKWYYEVEVLTAGSIKIGWTLASCYPNCDISNDSVSFSFDVSASTKWHNSCSDHFGKACAVGDIVGVMIDLVDKTISFSLNGEFLLDSVGSEAAFDTLTIDSYVPAFSLYSGQKIRVNFGQDVNSLRYFTNCGLQEGYEPFAVNMTKAITFWYSNEVPNFEAIDDTHESLEIIPSTGQDSSPCFKIVSKSFGAGKTRMEYMRLSLPVTFHEEFTPRAILREKRMNALSIYKSQLEEEAENQQMYTYDQGDMGYPQMDMNDNMNQASAKPSGLFSKISPKQNRSKSPFKLLTKFSREQSPNQKNIKSVEQKAKFSRSSEYGTNQAQFSNMNQADFFLNQNTFDPTKEIDTFGYPEGESAYVENDDMELQAIMEHVEEYYYGVRIFPGQDPSKVFVGWTTSRFHLVSERLYNKFGLDAISKCTLINTTSDGSITSSLTRKDCFLISASELTQNNVEQDAKKNSDGLLIGCVVDLSTGVLSFSINGKEAPQKFQVEPGTKLYPALFAEPTTKEMLQLELSRIRNCLPLSAALFPSLGKHVVSKCPSRLKLQFLKPTKWSRVLNQNLKVHTLKMNNILGWSLLCEENVNIMAVNIPEEDRWISVLELNENSTLLEFYSNMISLYEAVCAQSNNYVAHQVSKQIDERQLMYCIENHYLSGLLRKGFYDLLIKLHLEAFVAARTMTKHEYVIPLTQGLTNNVLENHEALMVKGQFPSREEFYSVRPSIIKEEEIKIDSHKLLLIPPAFNLENLKNFIISSFSESVRTCAAHIRDPIGGTKSFLFVPIIKLLNQLLMIDVFSEQDLNLFMTLLDPHRFTTENFQIEEGLLDLNLEDDIKYEICLLLHSLCDYNLRFRIEAIANFSTTFVDQVQRDQKKRYTELKESKLPSAVMAKKTKEFRCGAKDQMQYIVKFKDEESSQIDMNEEIKTSLTAFHEKLNKIAQIKQRPVEEKPPEVEEKSVVTKIFRTLFFPEYTNGKTIDSADSHVVEEVTEKLAEMEAVPPEAAFITYNYVFSDFIKETIIKWAQGSFITDNTLVRSMFDLIYRQYNALGEISECLNKTYVIGESSVNDVTNLLRGLSTVRSLLCVQMGPCEEEIMKGYLNEIMDNKVFFQHPDLMRALCVHETVMQVMINWLNRRQHQQESTTEVVSNPENAISVLPSASQPEEPPKEENAELVVVCCKFLSYFSRTSRHNQRAMFEHLSYLLDNSSMLLSRPSLRGSCPLDVACSSLMDNNDLSLALRESHLEKISVYLSRCGLQSNQDLLAKGYPDIGWDPVEGERFLDFLKFCVWVNGDSVEENANLIVRLLIRRPECLGPALRGEGGGLLKATIDGLKISLQIAATQNIQNPIVMSALLDADSEIIDFMNENKFDFTRIPSEEDEDYIDLGAAMVSFYISLVELLGRSAPSEETIKMGKSDSIRARSILRSLVSMEDLERVLSIRFILPIPAQPSLNEHLPGLQPSHKMSIVLFLERVYGIPDQATFLKILETAFLPDIRCATILDASSCAEGDMALALNRYLCCSVLPLLTSYSHYFDASENKTSLMETVLNTVYRLSKCKSLTTGQLNIVCEFLIAFTNQMKPPMMRNLLRKLVVDLPTLDECTIVPLKMLTLWYERCGKYYGTSPMGIQATEEEKRLTMTLFTRIFDALAKRTYNPELFSKALPCLSAIGCALSPDYSYIVTSQEVSYQADSSQKSKRFEPQPIQTVNISLTADFESLSKQYSEHVHDYWCFNKFEEGWSYGEVFNDAQKSHSLLKPYQNLSRKEQMKYEDLTREILKSIKALGWTLDKADMNSSSKNAPRLIQNKLKESVNTNGFYPRPFDLTSTTLTRELEDLAVNLAINCHNIRAKKKQNELENIGAELHHLLVPYDLLTDREKVNDRHFTNELLKFLQINGYRVQAPPETNNNRLSYNKMSLGESEAPKETNEIKFAFNLLEKLLEYVDKAAMNMQSLKESAKFTRKTSFKTSGQDVKFFTKVVLPLIEKYFQSQRGYFIFKTNINKPGAGVATSKEKEMTCSLFCKLALLMRKKLSCFGSDTNITVRCLQVLIKAVDVSSVMKNSQEIVRASLLPLFSYAADDLNNIIEDLRNARLSNIKGTSQKTLSNIDYINMVLLPVLAAMFEHIGANKYGSDVMVGEIQLLSYKILNALWILGTLGTKLIDREWITNELNRHRPLIGDCLRSFAASFPIAFLEPSCNSNNKYSIMFGMSGDNLSEHSLEGQDIMNKVSKNLPSLQDLVNEIGQVCESGVKYEEAPHVVEILLPTICSYLNYWWNFGPSARQINDSIMAKKNQLEKTSSVEAEKPPTQTTTAQSAGKPSSAAAANVTTPTEKFDGALVTNVTSEMMNQILGYILLLINNSVEETKASWMNRIATFSGSIISNSTPDLLEKFFLPVSSKISLKADEIYNKELSIKAATRNADATERESAEGELQQEYEILIRDIYAFYPLLIKYVDLHKGFWIKNPDENSEKLYYNVAEVFNLWLKSKIFQKEEKTFVSQNEIDNMLLIMPNTSNNLITTEMAQPQAENPHKGGKKRKSKGSAKKFTSLIVASLRRLIQIGINFFGGSEQELIQMAKHKFITLTYAASLKSADILLNKDQEDVVEDFIRRYLKSSAESSGDNQAANETIDKDTYQKTKWQRMLYKKIGSKRNLVTTMVNLSQDELSMRIMDIAKVLHGLHMVEHPQVKSSGILRKLVSGQRKKAIMGCFRMAPLYSIANHRAINIFFKSYKTHWLDNEGENDTDIACLIPDLCPQEEKAEVSGESAEGSNGEEKKETEEGAVVVAKSENPDPLRQLITTFNYAATTDSGTGNNLAGDVIYMSFATIMSKSCVIEEEEEGGGEEGGEEDATNAFEEQEIKKQKLLYEQNRLAGRGAAEMVLLYISASKGEKTEMLDKTLQLGISLLHGGNVECQHRMLNHLRDKKDSGFFTSLAGLMSSCTVLDLDTFERCLKAEQFGGKADGDGSGMAGKKNLHDADFTCSIFRFLQLLCEGHNLEFQNYLRAQPGNNTIVNTIICTVDYLLRLQESIMDFYWHYSGKSTVDDAGKENFGKAITIASQVFNTLTEFMQGPCVGNQLTLANSRLWDAIGGFLMIFANMQEKLSRDPNQIDFLRDLMSLQKDMIIMLLSMLEGNVLNGPIGKQMVDTLIENQQNVEMILKFFDIFLKMKDLTSSESFLEFDTNGDGVISPKEFRKAMEAQKAYTSEEIEYVLQTVDTNQDGKIDFNEISERFHNPAKDIGFNMAVLLTNLSEHMSHDARLDRLIKKASSFINFFEPYLGRIEITGSSGRIERVYFEIKESNLEQWEKPQIKDSKRQFLFDIVNEGDAKEKLEHFVNFCEDTIFEMQHAASISASEEPAPHSSENTSVFRKVIDSSKTAIFFLLETFSPNKLKSQIADLKQMTKYELFKFFLKTNVDVTFFIVRMLVALTVLIFRCLYLMTLGHSTQTKEKSALAQLIQSETVSSSKSNLAITDSASHEEGQSELPTESESHEISSPIVEHTSYDETLSSESVSESKSKNGEEAKATGEETGEPAVDGEGQAAPAPASGLNFKNLLSTLARNFYKLKYLALVLAFLINFLMLFYKARVMGGDESMSTDILSTEEGSEEEELLEIIMMDPDEYYIEYFLKVLAFIHSIVAFAMMVAYYVLKVPLVIFKREKEVARKLEFEGLWIAEQPSEDDLRSHWDKLVISTQTFPEMYWDKFVKKKCKNKYGEQFDFEQLCKLLGINAKADEYKVDEAGKKGKVAKPQETTGLLTKFRAIDWNYQIWKWGVIFSDNSFLYVFWYFCFSVIGNFNYFFFACHLVDVAISIKSLTTILKSITHNGKQLMLTMMLMAIVVYMYTVIAFNFFRKFYASEEDGEVEQNCHDLFTCFKFHLYIGIRSGGGIGDELESPVGDTMEFYRIIFDITFFFFIIVILLAIIQGLIIDAFGELRDQLNAVSETLEAACFICGIGKDYFDKVPHGFEIHTMKEHNFANYMFFLMHIINKPDTEHTGQETYVWQMYNQRCWDFFPAGDCFRKQYEGNPE